MAITSIAMQPAAIDLLGRTGSLDVARYQELSQLTAKGKLATATKRAITDEEGAQLKVWKADIGRWFAWLQCAFLFGAATGGLFFGRIGDRFGRSKAMAFSILTYSTMSAAARWVESPPQLVLVWFLACTGVGGMWPNGVALVSEAWANWSRPMTAGVIGTSANIGIFFLSSVAAKYPVTPANWTWMMVFGAAPVVLGLFSLLVVPESPRWLATQQQPQPKQSAGNANLEIFRPPLLGVTLIAIVLATIPMVGAWGSANWMVPWAAEAGDMATPPNPHLKANVQQCRSITGLVSSLLGGWIASRFGRRQTYFLASCAALAAAQYTFWFLVPTDREFLYGVAVLGFFSGIYFGWMPLCLPELFPTKVRSTGAGVGFNFGRIVTAMTVFAAGALMTYFGGDYARLGRVTSLIFLLGMIAIWFVPDTSRSQLKD